MKKPFLPRGRPSFNRVILKAVEGVLASGKVNIWIGRHDYAFEKEYCQYLGVKHAIAIAN